MRAAACCQATSLRTQAVARSDDAGPVISIRRAAHSLRTASGDSPVAYAPGAPHADSPSCELTRLFPQRTTSVQESGVRSQGSATSACHVDAAAVAAGAVWAFSWRR